MTPGMAWDGVREDAKRGTRALVGGALGIALGIASLIFFGSLGLGVDEGVLKRVLSRLPVGTVEVRPKGGVPVGFLRFEGSEVFYRPLDAGAVESLRTTEGVKAVYPRVAAQFPMRAQGGKALVGRDVFTDVFASGVDGDYLKEDLPPGTVFEDVETGPIPAVVSSQLVELFNRSIGPSIGVPGLSPDLLIGFAFNVILGESYMSGRMSGGQRVTIQIVGVSDRAVLLGFTVPRKTVERWNRQFAQEQPKGFASAYVVTDDGAGLSHVVKKSEEMGFVVEQNAKLAGTMVLALTSTWLLVALLILVVAAFNVAQTLNARVQARRREIGLMRAVGATQRDVMTLVMGEAFLIAAGASVMGLLLGIGGALGTDFLVVKYLPKIPFQPDTFFLFPWWLIVGAVVAAVLSALLGAIPPARSAARLDPARALEG